MAKGELSTEGDEFVGRQVERFGCCSAIGPDQTAHPELGSTKPAHHHHRQVHQLATFDGRQDGLARGT